jgi:hypothetical protein
MVILAAGCNRATDQYIPKGELTLLRISFPKYFEQEVTYHTHIYNLNTGSSSDETTVLKYRLDAEKPASDTINFKGNLISVMIESDHAGKKVVYNSSDPSRTGRDRLLIEEKVSKLLHENFTFSMLDKGKVLKNIVFDNVDSSQQYEPLPLPYYIVSFPEEKVGVGSFWKNIYTNTETGDKISAQYKIKSIEDLEAVIDARIDVTDKNLNKSFFMGHYRVDSTTGMPISCNMSGRIVGTGIEVTYYFTTKTSYL